MTDSTAGGGVAIVLLAATTGRGVAQERSLYERIGRYDGDRRGGVAVGPSRES